MKELLLFKRSVLILGFAVSLLAAIEAGFRTRTYLDTFFRAPAMPQQGRYRILLLGDSAMGTEGIVGPARFLGDDLEALRPGTFEVMNRSVPGLTTAGANSAADAILAEYRPQLTVLLLGKNQVVGGSSRNQPPSFRYKVIEAMSHLRVARLYWFLLDQVVTLTAQAHALVNQAIKPEATAQDVADQLYNLFLSNDEAMAWTWFLEHPDWSTKYSSAVKCLLEIEHARSAIMLGKAEARALTQSMLACASTKNASGFSAEDRGRIYYRTATLLKLVNENDLSRQFLKKALAAVPTDYDTNLQLAWSFFPVENNCTKAIPYFEEGLRPQPVDRRAELDRLFNCIIETKQFTRGRSFFAEIAPRVKTERSLIRFYLSELDDRILNRKSVPNDDYRLQEMPDDADSFAASLWLCRRQNLHQKANALFRVQDQYASSLGEDVDVHSYQSLVAKALQSGAKVLAVQYANEPDWPLVRALGGYADSVDRLSLRAALINHLTEHSILEDFDDDFVHFSNVGAQIAADALAERIVSVANTRKPAPKYGGRLAL